MIQRGDGRALPNFGARLGRTVKEQVIQETAFDRDLSAIRQINADLSSADRNEVDALQNAMR